MLIGVTVGIAKHLIVLMRNLYFNQSATVRTEHSNTEYFGVRKGVHKAVLSRLRYMQKYMQK